jgi:hypothetical protein
LEVKVLLTIFVQSILSIIVIIISFDYDQVQFQILHSRPFDYHQVPPTPLLLGKLVQHRMTVQVEKPPITLSGGS